MSDQAINKLSELAAKLGTTAEYLWAVLVRQAGISAIIDIMILLAITAAMSLFYRRIKINSLVPAKTEQNEYPRANWDSDQRLVMRVVFGCLLGVCVVTALLSLTNIFTALLNPEYWALKQILDASK